MLYIFGVATPERVALSDQICTALQLAEHWQDVAEDLANGRVYLPAEDLERFGVTEADLAAPAASLAVEELMRFETARAAAAARSRAPRWSARCAARARLAVAGYLAGGRAALAAIRAPALRRPARRPPGRASRAGRRAGQGLRERKVSRPPWT